MCKYCNPSTNSPVIWITHELYKYAEDKNYLAVDLNTIHDVIPKKAKLVVENCINDRVSRMGFEIKYCPMCGRKLSDSNGN